MKNIKRKATIKDIARETDLSITAVSLILNDKADRIPQETKDRVFKAVKELDYRPNQSAVAMKTNKSGSIGLIIPDFSNTFFAAIAKSTNKYAIEKGYRLLITESQTDSDFIETVVDPLLNQQVDGVIFSKSTLSTELQEQLINLFKRNGIPLVMIDSDEQKNLASVMIDHEQGAYLATKHLIENGHKSIGCYTGPKTNLTSNTRIKGYQRALKEHGLSFDQTLLFEGDYSIKEDKALKHFMDKNVTAIFCLNDMMAFGIYRQAFEAGISIPENISVIGFDDIPISNIVNPLLTTVRQPIKDIARSAVELLDDLNKKGQLSVEESLIKLDTQLIVRNSVRRVGDEN